MPKIIIFGDESIGKTTFIRNASIDLFESDHAMTIGVDFYYKIVSVDGKNVKLQIWDFPKVERFKFLLPSYVRGAQGGLFVLDIADSSSLSHIDDWLSVIRKELRAEDFFPILAVGILLNEDIERQVSAEEAIKIAKSRNLTGFIECNLNTGENVERAFEALARLILEDKY